MVPLAVRQPPAWRPATLPRPGVGARPTMASSGPELGAYDPSRLPASVAMVGGGAVAALVLAGHVGAPFNTMLKVAGWGAVGFGIYNLLSGEPGLPAPKGAAPGAAMPAAPVVPPTAAPITVVPAEADFDKVRIAFTEPRMYQNVPPDMFGRTNYPIGLVVTNNADRPVTFIVEVMATEWIYGPLARGRGQSGLVAQTTVTAPPHQNVQIALEGEVLTGGLPFASFEVKLEAFKRRGAEAAVKASEVTFFTR